MRPVTWYTLAQLRAFNRRGRRVRLWSWGEAVTLAAFALAIWALLVVANVSMP